MATTDYSRINAMIDLCAPSSIEEGTYTLADLNDQVAWNEGFTIGRPAGVPQVDDDEWYMADDTVGLEHRYIKRYFAPPLNAEDRSRDVQHHVEDHIEALQSSHEWLARDLTQDCWSLGTLNDYIYLTKLIAHLKRLR